MIFTCVLPIRFAHCDPVGIVFYPRYFELFNGVVEDWCEWGLGCSFRVLHMEQGRGLPTVHIECDFIKPSELGETLQAQLVVTQLGTTSLQIEISLWGPDAAVRVVAKLVLVMMELKTRKAIALPEQLRKKIAHYEREKP